MERFDNTPSQYDLYEDLNKIFPEIYANAKPLPRRIELEEYKPHPFGEKKTYKQDWAIYSKACSQEKLILKEKIIGNIIWVQMH